MTNPGRTKRINALAGMLHSALSGDPAQSKAESAMHFWYADMGGLQLSRAEARALEEAADFLLGAYPKIGRKTILNALQKLCCELIPNLHSTTTAQSIALKLPGLLDQMGVLANQSTAVYVEVSGIDLKIPEWSFGPARLIHGNHPDVDTQRTQITTLDGLTPAPLRPEAVLVELKLEGESDFAREHGTERVQQILDCLQFLSIQENRGSWDSKMLGFSLISSAPIPIVDAQVWAYSSAGPRWQVWNGAAPIPSTGPIKLVIDGSATARFANRGGGELEALLSEPASSFDESLLTSIAWIANAIREQDLARKYLGFFIALEALFIRDNKDTRNQDGRQRPVVSIGEGAALLLGKNAEARRRIQRAIEELTATRNKIVHRGYTAVELGDLVHLAEHSWSCVMEAAKRRSLFKTDDSFRDVLQNCKFGGPAVPYPPCVSETDFTI